MARIDEIAPDLFRISIYAAPFNLQFNPFLVRDDEPLLFSCGLRGDVWGAARGGGESARSGGDSLANADALNHRLAAAPAVCSLVGALVSVNDFASRPARGMVQDEVLATGRYRFRFCSTAHLPLISDNFRRLPS